MSVLQYNKYIWLVDTIRSAGKITKEDIDRKWGSSSYNENHESRFPERTFFRCKNDILSLFDIEIKCDRANGSVYYIDESDSNSQTKQWLLSQFAMSQSLDTSRELRDCILYEPIPAGTEYLTTIVDAIRDSRMLHVTHLRFDSTEAPHIFFFAPYCLKVFKQRWYMLGVVEEIVDTGKPASKEPKMYALDRVHHLELLDRHFKRPKDFDAQAYFANFYGVFCGPQYKPEFVRAYIKNDVSAKYLRSLPLHHSQKEVEPCVFEWYIAPTLDFIQQLRTYGSELEILAPQSLREKFANEAKELSKLYL